MARVSSFLFLFIFSVVFVAASENAPKAPFEGCPYKPKVNAVEKSQATLETRSAAGSSILPSENKWELAERTLIYLFLRLASDIIENIIIAIDCYLHSPNTKAQQEVYKKVAEELKRQLVKSLQQQQ